jgi:NTE family protein
MGLLKNIKRVGGTSAGAITALLLCLNYSATEIEQTIAHTRFQRFNSGRFFVAGGLYRLQKALWMVPYGQV